MVGDLVCHGGLDEAWRDHVHPDPEPAQLLRGRPGESDDAGLGRGVVGLSRVAHLPRDAGQVDDGAAPDLAHLHEPGEDLVGGEGALEVGVHPRRRSSPRTS